MKNQNTQNAVTQTTTGSAINRILHVPIGALSGSCPDELCKLLKEVEAELERSKRIKSWIQQAISMKYENVIREQRRNLCKDTGTVHVLDNGFRVTHELAKKVEWDQRELKKVIAKLLMQGANVDDYIITTYKVSELKYKGWPAPVQHMFAPARVVGVGSSTYKLTKLDNAAEVSYE